MAGAGSCIPLNSCSQAPLLPRSRTSGARGGRSTRTWWTRTPPPLTLPGARRVHRTPSSLSRRQRGCGMSLRDPRPRNGKRPRSTGWRVWCGRCWQEGAALPAARAWAGPEGTCSRTPVVASPSPARTMPTQMRCAAPCAEQTQWVPCPCSVEDDGLWCWPGWWPHCVPATATVEPRRCLAHCSTTPGFSTSTSGRIAGLLHLSGLQPLACTVPGVRLGPVLRWSLVTLSPHHGPAGLGFSTCVGWEGLIKDWIFLHTLAPFFLKTWSSCSCAFPCEPW